jgi:hypothetical protein
VRVGDIRIDITCPGPLLSTVPYRSACISRAISTRVATAAEFSPAAWEASSR